MLKLCATQYFMKVKADMLLSNFYKVYRFNGILNDSFSAQCRIVWALLMLYNPAVDNPQSFYFLGSIPAGKKQRVQKTTVTQAKEFLFFNNFLPHIPRPLNQWPPVFSRQWVTIQSKQCAARNVIFCFPANLGISDSSFGSKYFLTFPVSCEIVDQNS